MRGEEITANTIAHFQDKLGDRSDRSKNHRRRRRARSVDDFSIVESKTEAEEASRNLLKHKHSSSDCSGTVSLSESVSDMSSEEDSDESDDRVQIPRFDLRGRVRNRGRKW